MADETTRNLKAAKNGDVEAFVALFEQFRPLVHAVAGRLVGPDDAEDVVMETYLKAWQALPRFGGRSRLSTWLYRIARNCALDVLRRRETRRERLLARDESESEAVERAPDPAAVRPDRAMEGQELGDAIARAMARLPDVHRVALELRFVDGLSYAEVAAATGISIGTVMSRLFNGRRKLQRLLAAEDWT
jgi:RNA polymerase sigma-70 factor (ECF subfamily)